MDFGRRVAASLQSEQFVLLDIGCAGGIDPMWRVFGANLRVLAVDASVDECKRLGEAETLPGVEYVSGFVGLPPDHPFELRRAGRPESARNPWARLSAAHTAERREAALRLASDREKLRQSIWWLTHTADPSRPLIVPEMLQQRGIANVDFIKIDTDGNDLAILHSFDSVLDRCGVLGAKLEVNFCGSEDDTNRTFHNTDRFMKAQGFELFDLTVRRYSAAALPARYELDFPAQTVSGRVLQGDAIYLRDWAAPYWRDRADRMSDDKLAKLAVLFALFALPDCAAEIVVGFRDRLAGLFDVEAALDALAREAQPGSLDPLSYRDYLAAFDFDSPAFYPRRR